MITSRLRKPKLADALFYWNDFGWASGINLQIAGMVRSRGVESGKPLPQSSSPFFSYPANLRE
jgi:hypothetical protein